MFEPLAISLPRLTELPHPLWWGAIMVLTFLTGASLAWFALLQAKAEAERQRDARARLSDYERSRADMPIGRFKPLLSSLVRFNERFKPTRSWLENNEGKWEPLLSKAGEPGNLNAREFLVLKQQAPLVIFVLCFAFLGPPHLPLIVAVAGFGFFLPDQWLRDRVKQRQNQINLTLPDALDTMSLVVGAGLTFSEALNVYLKSNPTGPLSEEFEIMRNQMALGVSRAQAITEMADRVESTSLKNFASAVTQSERTGTPLAQTLENQAGDLRLQRFQHAEELGQKAPVKMLAPLLLLVFPCIFIVLFAPMGIRYLMGGTF